MRVSSTLIATLLNECQVTNCVLVTTLVVALENTAQKRDVAGSQLSSAVSTYMGVENRCAKSSSLSKAKIYV